MKVLYLGCFYDGSGYSQAAIDYSLAMDLIGIDIVTRPIKLHGQYFKVPERIKELELKHTAGCDICIQHCLPSMFEYDGNFKKNIGLFAWETDMLPDGWVEKCNIMDEIWVINEHMFNVCKTQDVSVPVKIIPHCTNIEKYEQSYPWPKQLKNLPKSFYFYTINDLTKRKNLSAILKAFHLEFDPSESVDLIIKTSKKIGDFHKNVLEGLRVYPNLEDYKKPIVLTDRLTEEEIYGIHYNANCFVSSSYGEAWCIPAMDAIGFGKTPIVPNHTGFRDYMNPDIGYLVSSKSEPIFGALDLNPQLYNAEHNWYGVDISHLRYLMRDAYENEAHRKLKSQKCVEYIERFSYEQIGNLIKKELYGTQEKL